VGVTFSPEQRAAAARVAPLAHALHGVHAPARGAATQARRLEAGASCTRLTRRRRGRPRAVVRARHPHRSRSTASIQTGTRLSSPTRAGAAARRRSRPADSLSNCATRCTKRSRVDDDVACDESLRHTFALYAVCLRVPQFHRHDPAEEAPLVMVHAVVAIVICSRWTVTPVRHRPADCNRAGPR